MSVYVYKKIYLYVYIYIYIYVYIRGQLILGHFYKQSEANPNSKTNKVCLSHSGRLGAIGQQFKSYQKTYDSKRNSEHLDTYF